MTRARNSFTLLELVAVIAIISVTTLIVAPLLTDFTKNLELDLEAKKFRNTVRYGRFLAVSTGKPCYLRIYCSSNSYELYRAEGNPQSWVLDKNLKTKTGILISKIEIGNQTTNYGSIYFDSLGSTSVAVQVYFTKSGAGDRDKIVSVSTTGRVAIIN